MRKWIFATAFMAVALIAPATASAGRRYHHHERRWYLTHQEAHRDVVLHFRYELGYRLVVAACRLQGDQKAQSGYAYHEWECSVTAAPTVETPERDYCEAEVIVEGNEERTPFYVVPLSSNKHCPLGVGSPL